MKPLFIVLLGATATTAMSSFAAAAPASSYEESYTYIKPNVDLAKYKSLLIKPTSVSSEPAAQFDGISVEDQWKFAQLVTDALGAEMPKSFNVVQAKGPHTIALQVTILGAKKTTGGVATATRILPIGLATNAFKSAEGKSGTLTGSLLVEVDITDASTGELLAAAIRRRAPDALNVGATLSTTDTVKAVANEMAKTLREKLIEAGMAVQVGP